MKGREELNNYYSNTHQGTEIYAKREYRKGGCVVAACAKNRLFYNVYTLLACLTNIGAVTPNFIVRITVGIYMRAVAEENVCVCINTQHKYVCAPSLARELSGGCVRQDATWLGWVCASKGWFIRG